MGTKRIDIIKGIIKNWGNILGLPSDYCNAYIKGGNSMHVYIRFKDVWVDRLVFDMFEFPRDLYLIPTEFLKEDVENFFSLISLFLYANKNKELQFITKIIEKDGKIYINIKKELRDRDSKLLKLLEKVKTRSSSSIFETNKEALYTYYMFYNNSNE